MFIKRFRREANMIAGLQSPHTVYLYDFGTAQDGRFYYVMELLDGISLQTLVTTFGPQPASRVVFILRQICSSLDEAHEQGLVHRDLKPSNVMLCKVAKRHDFVKVLDFGLAKSVARVERADVSQLTVEGVAAGTPGYIAPEVALGDADVDARADLYALGCVAYVLLTGTLVFPDPNPLSMTLKHVQAAPDPPSLRTELPIPPDLERIILQCLEKNPADRPSSARELDEMLGDLRRLRLDRARRHQLVGAPPAAVVVAAVIRSGVAAHAAGGPEGLTMNTSEPRTLISHPELHSHQSLSALQDARRAPQESARTAALAVRGRPGRRGCRCAAAHRQHLPAAGWLFADEAGARRPRS